MEWLRPLARYAAVLVPAARGDWATAEAQLRGGAADAADYQLMVVSAALGQAEVAAARGEHPDVLRALEPLVRKRWAEVAGSDLWPWPELYLDALVSVGELAEADELLARYEALAAAQHNPAMLARLGRPRGRLLAARGQLQDAKPAFERALTALGELGMPFHQAQVELTYGQALRRAGQRRAAATQLQAAQSRFRDLRAFPYLQRCDRELLGCGLHPGQASRSRSHDAHPAGAGGGPAGRGGDEQPSGGRGAVHLGEDGAVPPDCTSTPSSASARAPSWPPSTGTDSTRGVMTTQDPTDGSSADARRVLRPWQPDERA